MSKQSTTKNVAFGIGGALSLLIGGIIAWGQFRPNIPQRQVGYWPGSECGVKGTWPTVCVEKTVPREWSDAVSRWQSHGYAVPEPVRKVACGIVQHQISIRLDPSLDMPDMLADDDPHFYKDDPTPPPITERVLFGDTDFYDLDGHPFRLGSCTKEKPCPLYSVDLRLSPTYATEETLVHELGHAFGFLHANGAPSGVVMNPDPDRAGLDFRGLDCLR